MPLWEQKTLCLHRHIWEVRYLPRNLEFQVDTLGRKETENILLERGLEILIKDDIFPVRFLDFLPQPCVLSPGALVEDPNFIV